MSKTHTNLKDIFIYLDNQYPSLKSSSQDLLQNYIDFPITTLENNNSDIPFQKIFVSVDEKEEVDSAHSLKPANLKFRWVEVVKQTIKSFAGQGISEWVLPLVLIDFAKQLHKLSNIEIEPQDAKVLIEIYKLSLESSKISIDDLRNQIDFMSSKELDTILLDVLKRLHNYEFISQKENSIELKEAIVVEMCYSSDG